MNRSISLKGLVIIWICLIFSSCGVKIIGAYDQVTDESIQTIQRDVVTLITKLERNFDDNLLAANSYKNFKSSYEDIDGGIKSLKIRCSTIPKYEIVIDQVKALDSNLALFEKNHKLTFTSREEIQPYKRGFESQFKALIILQNTLKRKSLTK